MRPIRRDLFLISYGLGWIMYGWGLIVQTPTDQRGLQLILRLAPLTTWAWLWITAGVIAIAGAVLRRRSRRWDDAGFIAAVVPPLVWSASNILAWIPEHVSPRGSSWLLMAAAAVVVAGGVETRDER